MRGDSMSNSALTSTALPAEIMRGCRFAQNFWDKSSMLRDGWTLTNNPTLDDGITCDGTNQKAEHTGPVRDVQSVSFWVTLGSTTEDILQLSAAHSIEAGAGTLTATGWAAPTIMVDGVVTAVITTARSFVTVTTATPFDADDIAVGEVAAYGDFKMEDLKIWARSAVLTLQEALDYTNNATWNWENLLRCNLQMRTHDYDPVNVRTLDSSGYGNHAQLGDGIGGAEPSQGAGRMEFDGSEYLIVPADASLPAGTYTVLMALQIDRVDATWDYLFDARVGGGTGYVVNSNVGTWGASTGSFFIDGDGPHASWVVAVDKGFHTLAIQGVTLDIASALHIFVADVIASFSHGTLFDFKIAAGTLTPTQVLDYHRSQMTVMGHQV